jgi:hypothetical protein
MQRLQEEAQRQAELAAAERVAAEAEKLQLAMNSEALRQAQLDEAKMVAERQARELARYRATVNDSAEAAR